MAELKQSTAELQAESTLDSLRAELGIGTAGELAAGTTPASLPAPSAATPSDPPPGTTPA